MVQRWPSTGTYWRASSHTGHASAGAGELDAAGQADRERHGPDPVTVGPVSARFIAADGVLLVIQAALVALPAGGVPHWLERAAGRGWALVLPLSVAVVVAAIELVPEVADGLTWVAFLLVPPGAALALGWAMRGARPAAAAAAAAALRARLGPSRARSRATPPQRS